MARAARWAAAPLQITTAHSVSLRASGSESEHEPGLSHGERDAAGRATATHHQCLAVPKARPMAGLGRQQVPTVVRPQRQRLGKSGPRWYARPYLSNYCRHIWHIYRITASGGGLRQAAAAATRERLRAGGQSCCRRQAPTCQPRPRLPTRGWLLQQLQRTATAAAAGEALSSRPVRRPAASNGL